MNGAKALAFARDRHHQASGDNARGKHQMMVIEVMIFYQIYDSPKVWLVDPDLELYEGNKPHHIYGDKDEKGHTRLCVYDPAQDKWNSQKSLAYVFVPWIITWLYAYEIWLICGKWTYPETTASDNADKPGKQQ